jgi:hypothetical protein
VIIADFGAQGGNLGGEFGERLRTGQFDRKQSVPTRGPAQRPPGWATSSRPTPGCAETAPGPARTPLPSTRRVAPDPRRAAGRARAGRPPHRTGRTRRSGPSRGRRRAPAARGLVIERDGLAGQLVNTAACERRDQWTKTDPVGGRGDRGQGDPRVGDGTHRRSVAHVIPEEKPSQPWASALAASSASGFGSASSSNGATKIPRLALIPVWTLHPATTAWGGGRRFRHSRTSSSATLVSGWLASRADRAFGGRVGDLADSGRQPECAGTPRR